MGQEKRVWGHLSSSICHLSNQSPDICLSKITFVETETNGHRSLSTDYARERCPWRPIGIVLGRIPSAEISGLSFSITVMHRGTRIMPQDPL
ncbi:hypothetical protein KQX54_020939 [Cotesia glomerata]|uniref:Uncharacterized protein n=1 Tax=Cotesia glomerata TaxID=32391 RepID=A0AAV7HMF1_COTGL|nr:hypothetical protein KQX54_020939 [Cotesia glomerata]